MTIVRIQLHPDGAAPEASLETPAPADEARVLLFDWSKLGSDRNWSGYKTHDAVWTRLGCAYARVALLHHRRWNRQAAYIGALLRVAGASVRSFSSWQREQAIHWLQSYKSTSRRRF